MLFSIFKYLFSFQRYSLKVDEIRKLANWWRHRLNRILIKYDEKRYLSQIVSEPFDSLQYDSSKSALIYKLTVLLPSQRAGF